jgi:hypothetical protein
MEEWVFSNSSAGAAMVNQMGGGLDGERAPRLGPGASDGEIVGLNATGDKAGAFTFFLPGSGAGLVLGTGVGGDARGIGGGVAMGGVAGEGVGGEGDARGGDASGEVAGGGVAGGGVAGGGVARGEKGERRITDWRKSCRRRQQRRRSAEESTGQKVSPLSLP